MTHKLIIVDSSVVIDAFDSNSKSHHVANLFIEGARENGFKLVMPMHAFFEVKCTMHRIAHFEKRKVSPPYKSFDTALPFVPQPIDQKFVDNYFEVDVPYAKAGDTIFLVMAKKLGLALVTHDTGMREKARSCGINALNAEEGLSYVTA